MRRHGPGGRDADCRAPPPGHRPTSRSPCRPPATAWWASLRAQFQGLLSPEDLDDIQAGDIPVETLRAYALSFAEGCGRGGSSASHDGQSGPATRCTSRPIPRGWPRSSRRSSAGVITSSVPRSTDGSG